ncbi:MAG: 4,5-DOPA dioxygenase extradiol [Ruminococcus sp.]|nr:4,5-DOPA dioxygenase extradiol [Ruminococcus sp.]
MKRMPVIFSGHGDPMIAIREDEVTRGMAKVGSDLIAKYGKPKAILSISGHWYTDHTAVQSAQEPKQIYDMYGFPQKLYEVKYPVKGCTELTEQVQQLLGDKVKIDDSWGIDHGTWTVLVHMFPDADIPVVQLSIDQHLSPQECYEIGEQLASLRKRGYLIFGSGNVVHNLMEVNWRKKDGTDMTVSFNNAIVDAVLSGDIDTVINFDKLEHNRYAVPTLEHYLPLLYCMGAAEGEPVEVFNNICNLGSMSMTGFIFG